MKQFKRIISLVIAMTMLVSMVSVGIVNAVAETATYILGDVNGDGRVNVFDATSVQMTLAEKPGYEIAEGTIEFATADVNKDGRLNIFDVTRIQQFVAEYESAIALGIGQVFTFGDDTDPTQPTEEETTPDVDPTQPTDEETTPDVDPTQPTVEETQPTEEETTPDVVDAGFYLVGTLNGVNLWDAATLTADRKFSGPDANGNYTLDWTFVMDDEIKVVAFDGTEITRWYKGTEDGEAPNYTIGTESKTGLCTVTFNPNGGIGTYGYFTVQQKTVVDPTEEETTPDVDPTTSDVDPTTPDVADAGYYLVGTLNGESLWNNAPLTPDRKLNGPDANGNYTLDWTFYMGDELKVVAYDGTTITRWFKDTTDPDNKNYSIGTESKTGLCTLTFNPNGGGWSYIYFTVQQKTVVDPTEEETTPDVEPTTVETTTVDPTDPVSTDEPTEEPTEAPAKLPVGYYLVGTLNGEDLWSVDALTEDRLLSENPGAEG